ncbi:chloride channel protein [Azospirillum halopraeferens]|uniref:chloride channel protein n=1 Tax=Azospirillum halopraeferens TaxID=34010 RepID=UPI0004081620|nr:chloride channel protein [Azospirillum halopraeferens]
MTESAIPGNRAESAAAAPARARHALRDSPLALIVLAATLGGAVGAGVAMLHAAVAWAQRTAFHLPAGTHLGADAALADWRVVAVPTVGGLALGLLLAGLKRWRPRDIVDPVEANALFGGRMSLLDSVRLTYLTLISNASGASVGMEAAYTQAGSGMTSRAGQWLRVRRGDLRTLVGCGAAAAIAAAYSAPLAGAFYAFELVLGGYTLATLAPVGAAAGVSVAVATWLSGAGHAAVAAPAGVALYGWDYLACAGVGFLSGWLAIAAMQAVTLAERAFRALPGPVWGRPALGGFGVGLLALAFPEVLGAGPGAAPPPLEIGAAALAALLVTKILASALSLGAGFRGGLFSASLFLGALFGGLLGLLAERYVPGLGLDAGALILVGMGAVAAGVVGGPMTMVLLVLEATADLTAAAGVLTGVVVSTTVVRHAFGYSFTTWRFHLRGVPIRGAHDVGWMGELTANRLMRRDHKTVPETTTLAGLRRLFPLGSVKAVFAVDTAGRYAGVVDMAAVHDPSYDPELEGMCVRDLALHRDAVLGERDDIRTVLARFRDSEAEILPVTAAGERAILGYITEAFALRRYSRELERLRGEETGDQGLYGRD